MNSPPLSSPEKVWKQFREFMAGFAAARELRNRAATVGALVLPFAFLEELADEKHTLALAKRLRGKGSDVR
jgi:hypothetical protein